jgi:hypothetical protein
MVVAVPPPIIFDLNSHGCGHVCLVKDYEYEQKVNWSFRRGLDADIRNGCHPFRGPRG